MRNLKTWKLLSMIFLLALFDIVLTDWLGQSGTYYTYQKKTIEDQGYRDLFYSDVLREKEDMLSEECKAALRNVENEVVYYPIPKSSADPSLTTSCTDTWMSERKYGGRRGHEGSDIMADIKERGRYPVVSMTDGVVTNLGWLEKGGYRIGITTDSGTYYYYAHLDSYSNIKKGDHVKAGELLGYMGDSGYGKEGTVGKFPVHLHVGIYFYKEGREVSVNPYYVLRALEEHQLEYEYS